LTAAQAAAACAAVKNAAGTSIGRLCTAVEWQAACEGSGGAPPAGQSKFSLTVSPTTYVAKICNDFNESTTPAVWPTGNQTPQAVAAGNFCAASWGAAGAISDMSGNLMEWTSTTVMSGGTTYYKIRGGAFNSPSGGTSCEFDFDIQQQGFANSDVGYRCCFDSPP
jgi:formylglycine-generating enzyme required for sulfatase activity